MRSLNWIPFCPKISSSAYQPALQGTIWNTWAKGMMSLNDWLFTLQHRPISEWQDVLEHRQRGAALFDKIYDRHASRVRNNLEMDYPDLAQVALEDTYGRVLSSSDRVDALDTSFVVLAGLMVQDLPSQLKGHYYGAIHHGATDQQLGNLQIIVEKLCLFYNHQDYCSLPFKTK